MALMKQIPEHARKPLTLDNGSEFSVHGVCQEKLGLAVFFCDSYASWQKGGVENTNGHSRRDLPKKNRYSFVCKKRTLMKRSPTTMKHAERNLEG